MDWGLGSVQPRTQGLFELAVVKRPWPHPTVQSHFFRKNRYFVGSHSLVKRARPYNFDEE